MIFWDVPIFNGDDQRKKPLKVRRLLLDHFKIAPKVLPKASSNQAYIFKCQQFKVNLIKLYKDLVEQNDDLIEGVVLKNIDSPYEFHQKKGIDTRFWIKVKKISNYAKI